MSKHALTEKLKKELVGENFDAMQVLNFFKKYNNDEVVIVMPKDNMIGVKLEGKSSDTGHAYDSVARTKSINLAFHPKEGKNLVYMG